VNNQYVFQRNRSNIDKVLGNPRVLTKNVNKMKHYTGCPRRNGQNFGRVFLMLKYTDITKNTYIQS